MKPQLNSWRNPYSAKIGGGHVEDGQYVVTMQVYLRKWHPRLWWMALRMIDWRETARRTR